MNRRRNIVIAITALLTLGTPAMASPMLMEMGVAEQLDEQTPALSVEGNTVGVQGAAGMTLEVVSLTGKSLLTVRIDSPSQRIDLNVPKGCYIIKVGKVVRKVSIR